MVTFNPVAYIRPPVDPAEGRGGKWKRRTGGSRQTYRILKTFVGSAEPDSVLLAWFFSDSLKSNAKYAYIQISTNC
jgi:hypothetical protein